MVDRQRLDLNVSRLALTVENSAGHEHRIRPIAARAAEIFSERISGLCPSVDPASRTGHLDALIAPGLSLDLARSSDEQVAKQIAGAWLEVFVRHLEA
jgi:hypothetical protein